MTCCERLYRASTTADTLDEQQDSVISGYSMTSLTLRMRNSAIDQDYTRYQREEVYTLSKRLLICHCTFLLLAVAAYIINIQDKLGRDYELIIIINGVSVIVFAFFLLCASFKKVFAEFLGPSLYGSFTIGVFVTYSMGALDETDGFMRSYILGQATLYYLLYIGMQQTRVHIHIFIRMLIHGPCQTIIMIARESKGEILAWHAAYLLIFGTLMAELCFFVQAKANTKLFLALKITDFQQKQLFNLLDSVPDKVLIVSRGNENQLAKAVYTNRQMTEFFGSDPTAPMTQSNSNRKQRKGEKRHPMKNRIFEFMQPDNSSGSHCTNSFTENHQLQETDR